MSTVGKFRLGADPLRGLSADRIPGLVWGVRCAGNDVAPLDTFEPPRQGEWIWLHFTLADARARAWLARTDLVPKPAVDCLLSNDETMRIAPLKECVVGVLCDFIMDFDHVSSEFDHFRFALVDGVLITARRRALHAVEAVRQSIETGHRYASPADLLAAAVDQVANTIDHILAKLADDTDVIEDAILKEGVRDERGRLGAARLTSVRLHRRLTSLRRVLRSVATNSGQGPAALDAALGPVTDRLTDLDHNLIDLHDRARLLQDELSARMTEQANRHLAQLSIVAALFMPPTLIAGLFGMNLAGIPFSDSPNGFWWGVGLTIASSVATLLVLRFLGLFK